MRPRRRSTAGRRTRRQTTCATWSVATVGARSRGGARSSKPPRAASAHSNRERPHGVRDWNPPGAGRLGVRDRAAARPRPRVLPDGAGVAPNARAGRGRAAAGDEAVRRWGKRVALAAVGLLATAVVAGAGFEAVMRHRAARQYPAPGRLVDIGGRRLQLDCRGSGSPTVVLESGLDNLGSLSWAAVHDSIARTTRVCAYSRAGVLWSDPAPAPFDARQVAVDLHAALTASGETAPWVMVGHSLGGPYVVLFASRYGAEVAGVVLVDASHPEQLARLGAAAGKSMQPATGAMAIGSALAWTGIVRLVSGGAAPATWPAVARVVPRAYLPSSVEAMRRE